MYKNPGLGPAATYAQRWALCSNNPTNVSVSVKWVDVVKRISGDSLPFHLLSCESWIFVKENLDRKKNEFCFRTCKNRLSVYDGWRASWIFHDGCPYHIETRPLISRENQWTGFYTIGTFVMKELMLSYLHVFIEIYSLILTNLLTPMHPNIPRGCF